MTQQAFLKQNKINITLFPYIAIPSFDTHLFVFLHKDSMKNSFKYL